MYKGLRPVRAEDLHAGEEYFTVAYLDRDMRIPIVRTISCLGKDVFNDGDNLWYFQDAKSFAQYGACADGSNDAEVFVVPDDALTFVYDLDQIIVELEECIRRRRAI